MNRNIVFVVRALAVYVLCAGAHALEADASALSGTFEASKIRQGLDRLGIHESCQIVVADECDLVETTAAQAMQRLLTKASVAAEIVAESKATGRTRVYLGRTSNLRAIRALADAGELSIRDVSADDDGFHLKQTSKGLVVAGANPRGVLYGVYALEDYLFTEAVGSLDIKQVPYFRKRGSGLHYTDVIFNAELESFPEEKAACLARLGINQMTDQGIGGHFTKFVRSDVFPFLAPPDEKFQQRLKEMSATCSKYGIDVYLFLVEPALEPVDGGFGHYPEEALGTVRPPWGADKDGVTRTLCVNSRLTQAYLRDMMKRLVREYPDIKGVDLYNLDVGSWLCTPELCERCKNACSDLSQKVFNPAETQAQLVTLLADAAREQRADFDFRFWSTVHYHGELFDKMIRATSGYTGLMSAWTGSDRSIMVPDSLKPTATCELTQELCRERGVPFYMMCEFNNLEVIPKSLPFPFHVSDTIKKYKRWNVENLTEIFGVAPEHNSINALATKTFEWNPDESPEARLNSLARRQFGQPAGDLMYRAWEEMKKAFDVWNDTEMLPFPLMGSQFHTKMGVAIGGLPPTIVPEGVQTYDATIETLSRVEPWLAEGYERHKSRAFLVTLERMRDYLRQAATLANEAIDAASDEAFIGTCVYEGERGRPTCREYAELNHAPLAIAESLCTQRCNLIRAYHLLKEIEAAHVAADETSARQKEAAYRQLIEDDIGVQERFLALLAGFSSMQPCYTRTSLTAQEISTYTAFTQTKIDALRAYLAATSSSN